MTSAVLFAFASVLAVSLISFIGVLGLSERILRKYLFLFISVAAGALLGDAFIHLIPESLAAGGGGPLPAVLVISGIILFFVVEKYLHWHHHGEDAESHVHPVGRLILFSDAIHNLLDGIIIAASFMVSVPVGLATTMAVILHEIPQEVGDFAVLVHAGYTRRRALLLNFLSGLCAVFGALLFFLFASLSGLVEGVFLPVIAGGFIYIAIADIIPELQKTKDPRHSFFQLIALILGVAAMLLLTLVE